MNGGDLVAQVLVQQGVRFLYTLCGGHISPILVAAKRSGVRVIDTRHEATAVFAADATARLTGIPGVAAVTAGPGVTNTVTALKNAQMAHSPVVVLGGASATVLRGRGSLQDIDQHAVLRANVKWFAAVRRLRDLGPTLERAFRTAQEGVPGPVFVECPVDLLYDQETVRGFYGAKSAGDESPGWRARVERAWLNWHLRRLFAGADGFVPAAPSGPGAMPLNDKQIARVAAALSTAQRPLLLIGSQAVRSPSGAAEVAAAVDSLSLPVYLSGMARGLLGADHPLQIRHARRQALREADLVILAGVPCDFRLDYGRQIGRRATLIAANLSVRDLRLNRRPQIGLRGDPALFLLSLAAAAGRPAASWAEWRQALRSRDGEREAEIQSQAEEDLGAINSLRLLREIDRVLERDSVVIGDGGDFVASASYVVRPRGPLSWLDPGPFGTLGAGAGFALAAKLVRPESEVWLLWGDGSAGFGLTEIDTFARHGVPIIAVVGNDGGWSQIAREQVPLLGDDVGTVLGSAAYHTAAEALGGKGLLLERQVGTAATLVAAKGAARMGSPVLVNALIARGKFRQGSLSI